MLMKESSAFAVLPGGFGTLDECFELLTRLQTGKAEPAPIVLLDLPGDPFWEALERFLKGEVTRRGLVDHEDGALYRITDDVGVAVQEILRFYRNYHSRRFVGSTMVIRCRFAPTDSELAALNEQFADICSPKGIWRTGALPPERAGNDHLELKRLALEFDRRSHGRLGRSSTPSTAGPAPAERSVARLLGACTTGAVRPAPRARLRVRPRFAPGTTTSRARGRGLSWQAWRPGAAEPEESRRRHRQAARRECRDRPGSPPRSRLPQCLRSSRQLS